MEQLYSLKSSYVEPEKKQLILNSRQMGLFEFEPGQKISLKVGFDELEVEVSGTNCSSQENILYLSSAAFKDLTYYHGEALGFVFQSSNKLVLGPTIGLTVLKKTFKNISNVTPIEKRARLALKKGVLLYCFSLKTVDWENNLVYASYLNPNNYKWESKKIPVPEVIYDRGSHPGPRHVESYTQRGKVSNIQWINTTRTFGKWETYQAIKNSEETAEYMPKTTLLALVELKKFMKKYKSCYIKHNYSFLGRKVFRVEKSGKWYLLKTGGSSIKSLKFTTLKEIYLFLRKRFGKDALLQKRIYLAQIDDSPFDMRVLVQKNGNGKWVISGLNFRIAKPGAIITNFAAGAKDVFVKSGNKLLHPKLSWEKLEQFALKTACAMESSFGSLGEIGLDVGLDREGKLWVIEANSRPNDAAYRDAPAEACNQIYGLPLEYAKYLVLRRYN